MKLEDVKREISLGEAILIDVREQEEWDTRHLDGAVFVPLSELDMDEIPMDLPDDKRLYLYCRRGARAQRAAGILGEHYKDVQPLLYSFEELCEQFPSGSNCK